jgi:DNA transposition AAA+ family ATPase
MKNVFIQTRNARNFITTMKAAERMAGEPVLLLFHGQAGRGKTSASRFFSAQEGWTYVRALRGWTELWMLEDLCFELAINPIPHRRKQAFEAIRERLQAAPKPIVIDEADKLNDVLLDWIRDLADTSLVPFALVGEKLLIHKMQKERRIWRRTLSAVEFGPVEAQDIMFFAKEACSLNVGATQAELIRQSSEGDFGLVRNAMLHLEEVAGAAGTSRATDDMVRAALKAVVKGN